MFSEVLFYSDLTSWIVGLLVALAVFYIRSYRPKNLPPSPGIALPIIGHFYLLEKNPRKQLHQWSEKYGDVFSLQMGPRTTVFVNTFEAMKEAFVKKADYFSDRPDNLFITRHIPMFRNGIILTSGSEWKAQRSTSLAILRNFGMGKNILAEKISEEISYFVKELASKNGQPSDIRYLTNMSVSNVICSIIFGKRFSFDDERFKRQMWIYQESSKATSGVSILNYLPLLYYLPFDLFKGKHFLKISHARMEYTVALEAEARKISDAETNDNYIAAYIDEMKKENENGQTCYLNEAHLTQNIDNLFIAGSETTSTTILWGLVYIVRNPDVQKRIFDEILEHVGTERVPVITDKPKLKYLTAFIMEVQRKASIVPFSVIHLCNTDTTLAGFNVPKGAILMPNLDAVHKSKKVWGDPENFRPERFLDEHGNIIKREELIPFSIGRRICLGESLAKMELFLYLASMFQKFEFLPASLDEIPLETETWGIVAGPECAKYRCVERIKSL